MIYEDGDGTNVIQFGTGDIKVGNGRCLVEGGKGMAPCCIFVEQERHRIGEMVQPESEYDPAISRPDAHTMFIFTNPFSVDVLIDQLLQVKERFKLNGLKKMSMQEITDEVQNIADAQQVKWDKLLKE